MARRSTSALAGPPLAFPDTTVGQSTVRTMSLTANLDVDISQLSSNDARFVVGTPSEPLPAHIAAGQTITIPVTFTPTTAAVTSAYLTATTTAGPVTFGLSGTGLATGAQIVSTPSAISLGGAVVNGTPVTGSATLRNAGSLPLDHQRHQPARRAVLGQRLARTGIVARSGRAGRRQRHLRAHGGGRVHRRDRPGHHWR